MNTLPVTRQAPENEPIESHDLELLQHAPSIQNSTRLETLPSHFTSVSVHNHRRRHQIFIVISSLALTFTGCGLNFAFGVYQELYETLHGPFKDASAAQIDLIGTLAVSVMTLSAPFASAWTRTYSPQTVTLAGGFLMAVSNIAASFGQKLWHLHPHPGLVARLRNMSDVYPFCDCRTWLV